MEFNSGDRVQHKLCKNEMIILKLYPKRWFRKYPYYLCAVYPHYVLWSSIPNNNFYFFEAEIEKFNEIKEKRRKK